MPSPTNFRTFHRKYNTESGRYQFQHATGGKFFNSMRNVTPDLLVPGKTGPGHVQRQAIRQDMVESVEDKATELGEKILKNLHLRNHVNKSIRGTGLESRLQNLMTGSGLQISV